ncbi:hypothetical protein QVD17_26070 [Tagetes erecta]|uniref:F-box domain-containing protein n=1 Tax=Tagetes erecta TaxID=13708 RepID=A0AAD8KC65_TARER|nr:hypothetical protein QVD17_26070 [Tagetes erecta]
MKAKRRSEVQKLCPDRISTLPQTIIETILCLVSIKEAARTSILSTEWRFCYNAKVQYTSSSFTLVQIIAFMKLIK